MESAQARHQGSVDFEGYYKQLCALQDTCPLTCVKGHLQEGVLDINGDRVRQPDWAPILNALRINKTLRFIGVRSYFQHSGVNGVEGGSYSKDGKVRSRVKRRPPSIHSKDMTHRLCTGLKETLSLSQLLTYIELQGIPLKSRCLQLISKGIAKSKSLQHLSLELCHIGDRGVEILCQGIKNSPSISSLNLSSCGLTSRGAEQLAKLIKHQSTRRHSEAWKDSLRYRRPDLDQMSGIRRITLNYNPLVNDDGAVMFAEALQDDLWLKALDMQQCGLSNLGAKAFLDGIHQNNSIVVLDIRKNHLVDRELLKALMERVMINSGGDESEYKWLRAVSNKREVPSKPPSRKRTPSASGRKTTIHVSTSRTPPTHRHLVKPRDQGGGAGAGVSVVTNQVEAPAVTKPGPGFVPWRTAARANYRQIQPEEQVVQVDSSQPSRSASITAPTNTSWEDTSRNDAETSASTMLSTIKGTEDAALLRKMRDMRVDVEQLHRRLHIESQARAAADARVVELELTTSRLRHQVRLLEARSSPLRPARRQLPTEGAPSQLEDESVLDTIEESFAKFHGFLDFLREAGLGQLCSLVGMSPEEIHSPHVRSLLQQVQPLPLYHPATDPTTPHLTDDQQQSVDIRAGTSGPPMAPLVNNFTSGVITGSDPTTQTAAANTEPNNVYIHAQLVTEQNGRHGTGVCEQQMSPDDRESKPASQQSPSEGAFNNPPQTSDDRVAANPGDDNYPSANGEVMQLNFTNKTSHGSSGDAGLITLGKSDRKPGKRHKRSMGRERHQTPADGPPIDREHRGQSSHSSTLDSDSQKTSVGNRNSSPGSRDNASGDTYSVHEENGGISSTKSSEKANSNEEGFGGRSSDDDDF